ncbi:homeobox-leucine zipper protein HOX3-like [Andrographis paniculata]|uniref:homeobox-leucine zipper protein HOX3-like n=1 Tax=Andrographis paniculata TaxID=175694 RepID=UPI0021E889BE|nr:homeobox-leucine zipper protein HOX3-like [Andrographis paniculata]
MQREIVRTSLLAVLFAFFFSTNFQVSFMESHSSSCLDLTIAMPGFSSASPPASGESGCSDLMKEVDVNRVAASPGTEEECMEEEDDHDHGSPNCGPARRKKLRLTKEQSRLLEQSFRLNHTLNPKQKENLADQLNLMPRQVEVWFQNRRARSKLKQTEMECEYLKRWYGSLTEQNRKLQAEVEELRAIRAVPAHAPPPPASTLTMCPRCERVTANTPAASTATAATPSKLRFLQRRQPHTSCYN